MLYTVMITRKQVSCTYDDLPRKPRTVKPVHTTDSRVDSGGRSSVRGSSIVRWRACAVCCCALIKGCRRRRKSLSFMLVLCISTVRRFWYLTEPQAVRSPHHRQSHQVSSYAQHAMVNSHGDKRRFGPKRFGRAKVQHFFLCGYAQRCWLLLF